MMGRIDIPRDGQEPSVAWLEEDLRWTADNPFLANLLNQQFPASSIRPAHGQPGAKLLADAARYVNGRATWLGPDPEPLPDDAVE
jgi:hypothetical protein